ncbi:MULTISPECIES: MarR family winged helix-turn-helix transcriptional regulator [Clostridium]|uniref:HTH-type transcriptional regulator SarZ n=2 Tax=Clostridium TaxID=1485 RepID=A0A0E3JN53_CLOSL|nr:MULTISPECIES: MarR family transcriptional regulator [Clostridium]AKA68867.1 transcriptional regulator, MarR family [Clostridium scatologenes]AWI04921.1 MarR family transcriptional regulator [Clostridium drakei]
MNYESLKLDNQLCFALYACAKEVTRIYKPLLDKFGITYTQYITLLVLWEHDNITVKELGKKLHLDSGTLTPLLKKLENMKLLERLRDTHDERNVYIKLTDKGVNMRDEALEIPKKMFCSTGISIEEASNLKDKLKNLLNNLDEKA